MLLNVKVIKYIDDNTGEIICGEPLVEIRGLKLPEDGDILIPGIKHRIRHFGSFESVVDWMRKLINQVDEHGIERLK